MSKNRRERVWDVAYATAYANMVESMYQNHIKENKFLTRDEVVRKYNEIRTVAR